MNEKAAMPHKFYPATGEAQIKAMPEYWHTAYLRHGHARLQKPRTKQFSAERRPVKTGRPPKSF